MRKYWDVVFFTNSIPAAGALVYVTNSTTGALATLYSDNGVTPITNPVTCDQTGFFSFYTADGIYNLQYMIGPIALRTLTAVQIFDESQFASGGPNFALAMLAWFNSLPTSLPAQQGILWNNGGTLAKS